MSTDAISTPLWDIQTAARYLGIGQSSLRKHIKQGTGPAYIPLGPGGRKVKLRQSDLDEWLDGIKVSGKTSRRKITRIKETS